MLRGIARPELGGGELHTLAQFYISEGKRQESGKIYHSPERAESGKKVVKSGKKVALLHLEKFGSLGYSMRASILGLACKMACVVCWLR